MRTFGQAGFGAHTGRGRGMHAAPQVEHHLCPLLGDTDRPPQPGQFCHQEAPRCPGHGEKTQCDLVWVRQGELWQKSVGEPCSDDCSSREELWSNLVKKNFFLKINTF